MSSGNDQWLRTPAARTLLLAALTISLVLGIGFVVINTSPDTAVSALGKSAPLTDDQSRAQIIDSARQIVTVAQLRDVNGSYVFLSCTNEHDPPYQAALYLNFPLPDANSVRYIRDIAAAMVAHGWQESPSIGEHFGLKLSRDGVSSTFQRTPTTRGSEPCASTGSAATWLTMATTTRHGRTSPTSSAEAALQKHGVQPATVFEADGCQPSGLDETPIAVQRKRSACVGINDDRDNLADTRGRTSSQQGIEQTAADTTADGVWGQVDRVLDGAPIRGSRLPLHAVGVTHDRAVEFRREERQRGIGDRTETASPFLAVGWRGLEGGNAGQDVVCIDLADRVEVVRSGGPHGGFTCAQCRQQATG